MRANIGAVLLVASEFLLLAHPLLAGTREDCADCDPHSMVVRFAPDVVTPPLDLARQGVDFTLRPEEFDRMPEDLLEAVHAAGVESFSTVGANWRYVAPEDTLDALGERKELVDFKDIYLLNLRDGVDACAAIELLGQSRQVLVAQCNHLFEPASFPINPPNDPDYPYQWHLNNTGQTELGLPCDPNVDINAPEAWNLSHLAGSPIAIVDDGINTANVDLAPFIAPSPTSYNFATADSTAWNTGGHGTWTAGVAAARGDNHTQVTGIANCHASDPQYMLVALRVGCYGCWPFNPWNSARVSDALAHLASYPAVRISNHSYGNNTLSWKNCWDDPLLRDAFRNSYFSNNCMMASTGNEMQCAGSGCNPFGPDSCFSFPASYDDFCLGVTAVTCRGGLIHLMQQRGSYVDVAAPGGEANTLWTTGNDGNTYHGFCCTSAAAPMASGIASLMLGLNPSLTNDDVYGILKHSTASMANYGLGSTAVGSGLLKADAALGCLIWPYQVTSGTITTLAATTTLDLGEDVYLLRNVPGTGSAPDAWAPFRARKYRVNWSGQLKKPLSVPVSFQFAWNRGRATIGAPDIGHGEAMKYDHLASAGHAELLSLTPGGQAIFTTYTYKVMDVNTGQFVCWYPFKPNVSDPDVCATSQSFKIAYGAVYKLDTGPEGELAKPRAPLVAFDSTPFMTSTGLVRAQITFGVSLALSARLFDVSGRLVSQLCSRCDVSAGQHTFAWTVGSRSLPRGVYLLAIDVDAGPGTELRTTRQVVLARR